MNNASDQPPSTLPTLDPISPALRDVLALFDDDALADVKFPDVDNDALQAQAKEVEQRDSEVRRLEAALDEAKKRLDEANDGLLGKAQRAVAYARVYADGDVLLTSRLESIALPRAKPKASSQPPTQATSTPKKRGRPAKNAAETDTSLFTVPADDAEAAAA